MSYLNLRAAARRTSVSALVLTVMSATAYAHVTLEQREATVGTPQKIVLRVPHGCEGTPTVRVTVRIPEGFIGIKPMVKPGWQIETKRGAYGKSHSYFHGATFSEGVKELTWSGGGLPDAFYDEFALSGFVSGDLVSGGKLYFPVVQTCEKGVHNWVEIPDKADAALKEPAPGLMLTPKK